MIGQDNGKEEKSVKQDLEKLQGEWKLVRCEKDGAKLDIEAAKMIIKQNSYVLHMRPGSEKGTLSLGPSENPKTWDTQTEGSDEKVHAIYELNGNRLRFAYLMDNKRPSSFIGKRGSDEGHVLYVFERGDGKLEEKTDETPKNDAPKIVVAADKTPCRKELKLKQGDSWIVVAPNGKEVAFWAEKDRLGLAKTKSGLLCRWEREPHIEQGGVLYTDKTVVSELFVGDWQVSFVNDLNSSPELNVTVVVAKQEAKDK